MQTGGSGMSTTRSAIALLIVIVFAGSIAHADCQQTPPPERGQKSTKLPDLNGEWEGGEGHVTLHVLRDAGHVDAFFAEGAGKCPFGDVRGVLFQGDYDGHVLKGKLTQCTHARRIIRDCKWGATFKSDFYTTMLTEHDISGCYKTEHYKAIKEYPVPGECNLTRDETGDRWLEFHLTKTSLRCPDLDEVDYAQKVGARAQGIIMVASKVSTDPQTGRILARAQGLLGQGVNGLKIAATIGHECGEIRDAGNELRRFLDAVQEVNAATCGQYLARAFDHLFAAAGTLGQRLPDLPEVSTAFKLMAADRTFFQDVSHALNPEERWNAQFSGIEGYTMTCP